jgi:hypothetical protein
MKKYQEFISEGNVNEGFFKNLINKVGSFLSGSKSKIQEKINKMAEVEKDFIDKSDELNYDIFYSDSKKPQDPVLLNNARQKAAMSKRALEAMRIAKNAEINFIIKEIKEICGNDTSLINFYQKRKIVADSELAQYAYEKARKFKDYEYENSFYNQWKNLETEAKKYKSEPVYSDEPSFGSEGNWGMYDLPFREFTNQISGLPKADIAEMLEDAATIKYQMDRDFRIKSEELKELRAISYRSGDMQTFQMAKVRNEDLKSEYKRNSALLNNKISALRNRLKNI